MTKRAAWKDEVDYTWHYDSPVGSMTMASNGTALTGLWFDGQKHFGSTLPDKYQEKDLPIFRDTTKWLDIYFSGKDPGFTPPLELRGTDYQKDVWQTLFDEIPYGHTTTYGNLSFILSLRKSYAIGFRSVGNALARNPIVLIIPCHRVLGENGRLTGYAAGVEVKRKLLELETGKPY